MTRLILPGEHDRIVARMIRNIELQRVVRSPDRAGIAVFQGPQAVEKKPPSTTPTLTTEGPHQTQDSTALPDGSTGTKGRARTIDWWAEARSLAQESDEQVLKRWLLEQGYDPYVSIMQGPLPITNSVKATLPPTQEDATGYMNSYGDMEYKISETCVATTQVSARLDQSDFAKALPMRITCKSATKRKYTFDRHDDE